MELERSLHLYLKMFFGSQRKKYRQLPDSELIALYITDRCSHTLPVLYERYGHLVMGSCLKYLKQQENAEDVTMRIFGELGAKLLKHEITYFKSWLYQVTRNECLQFLRKHQPGANVEINELSTPIQPEPDDTPDLEGRLQLLERAITELKDEQRSCIELFYLKQLSYQQISDALELPLNTVKSAIQNGKRNLKLWMERQENQEGPNS